MRLLIVITALSLASIAQPSGAIAEENAIQGKWRLVYRESDGRKEDYGKDGTTFVVDETTWRIVETNSKRIAPDMPFANEARIRFTYAIDARNDPARIDLTAYFPPTETEPTPEELESRRAAGIFKIEEGRLHVCFSYSKKRPEAFESPKISGFSEPAHVGTPLYMIFERVE